MIETDENGQVKACRLTIAEIIALLLVNIDVKQNAKLLDARIAQAEAAEHLAEAFEAAYVLGGHACDEGAMDAAWKQYVAAREAVRKLEGQADGS